MNVVEGRREEADGDLKAKWSRGEKPAGSVFSLLDGIARYFYFTYSLLLIPSFLYKNILYNILAVWHTKKYLLKKSCICRDSRMLRE